MNGLVRWWQGLAERERRLVGGGLVLVIVALAYALLWEPAATGIGKLRADLPQLREQDASMRAMADEAKRLRAAAGTAVATAPSDRTAAVRRSLERAGLWRAGADPGPTVDATPQGPVRTLSVGGSTMPNGQPAPSRTSPPEVVADGERVRVRFDDIDYGVWIGWLAAAETELSARAARVTVATNAPRAPVGHVKVEAVIDWASASSPASSSPSSPRS